jgi:sugar lactone lactonase YvrE
MTVLQNGKVLLAAGEAGSNVLNTAELYDPGTGTWSPTGDLNVARFSHAEVLLPDGRVLVEGGNGTTSAGIQATAEIYDPGPGTWSLTGSLSQDRTEHTATLLLSGKVLVAGGQGNSSVTRSSSEIYDPALGGGKWTYTSSLKTARYGHTATLLQDGRVLVAGGYLTGSGLLSSAEIYDPVAGTWAYTGSLHAARHLHTATLLPDGKVLVTGGDLAGSGWLSSAEIYDPTTGTWNYTAGPLNESRGRHTATPLPDGRVLIAGGMSSGGMLSSAELYDPVSKSFSAAGPMVNGRFLHKAALLPNGRMLVAGGPPPVTELYYPACARYPSGYVPFTVVYSIAGPNSADDRLLVGAMTMANWSALQSLPLPSYPNQCFCGLVELSPGRMATALVPTPAERTGNFTPFAGLLVDPLTGLPFPSGLIPVSRLPDPMAWRLKTINSLPVNAGTIVTFTGGGANSTLATSAYVPQPSSTALDSAGDIYVAVEGQNQVYKITPSGDFVLVAGTGASGFSGDGGPATNATLFGVMAVALDTSGNLYIADQWNFRIRKVDPMGTITTVAGNGVAGYTGDGGPATSATLNGPTGVAVDASGSIFICDAINNVVRRVDATTQEITTVAGNGTAGYYGDGDLATNAKLNLSQPLSQQIALDSSGNLYIADSNNNRIRVVNMQTTAITVAGVTIQPGYIGTVAGNGMAGPSGDNGPATSASLSNPQGIAVDASGDIFFGGNGCSVRKVLASTGYITTFAGGACRFDGDGGPATSAGLVSPTGVAMDPSGNVLLADSANDRVRVVNTQAAPITVATVTVPPGNIATVAGGGSGGDDGLATSAVVSLPDAAALDGSGNLFLVESWVSRVRRVAAATGIITTVAGNTTSGFTDDGVLATSASLSYVADIAMDASGNIYLPETFNQRIRKVSAGYISTVAGNGTYGFSGDGGPAASANLADPEGVAVDASGNLYIADTGNNRIRKVTGSIITTVAGNGIAGFSGDAGPAAGASLDTPVAVAVEASGNLFITDANNQRIRVVNMQTTAITVAGVTIQPGSINTVAGNGNAGFSGDGGPATSASLFLSPWWDSASKISLDSAGNLYIVDTRNGRIRRVDALSGIINTVAGNGSGGFAGDGGPATSAPLVWVSGIAMGSSGNLYIADTSNNRIRKVSLGPLADLSAASLSFSGQGVGSTSAAQTVTLTNRGGADLLFSSIGASGDFAQVNNCPVFPAALNPGSNCTITVNFTPTATGSRTGTLSITDNAIGTPQTIRLSGTGQ